MSTESGEKPIAVSISESPDMARLGYGEEHLHEMVVSVARAVLRLADDSAVTSLAYGGDLRPGGFTWTLFALARGESRDSAIRQRRLYSYMAWPGYLSLSKSDEAELLNLCNFVRIRPEDAGVRDVDWDQRRDDPAVKEPELVASRCLTRMRELMTAGGGALLDGGTSPPLAARILLGGRLSGYSSFMPGLFEEFLVAGEQGVPTYVLGGFGGAARVLGEAMLSPDERPELSLHWHKEHTPGIETLIGQLKDHPHLARPEAAFDRLGRVLEDLRSKIAAGDDDIGNGLAADENRRLIRSEDEREIRALLARGIARIPVPGQGR